MSPVQLHLLMNQLPVAGAGLGVFILAWGVARREDALVRAALAVFVVAALATVTAFLTGERAEARIAAAGVAASLIDRHHQLARFATLTLAALGCASLLTLAAFRRRAFPRGLTVLLLALSLVPAGALVWTANRGGKIGDPELRPAAPAERRSPTRADAEDVGAYEP